ncbi:hypothetical protein LX32DRAFT_655366 [Colletotrichum zoysiae]|uniref:Uncharacterized protein n=1 Tax=Colletotrichum zoysiae TaxID=1216348 RepID=A0AAD9M1I1_9PEZI|nr:hypothetical protein LX32DRAFT_655366 [Colletotrichum zoysiae]
MVNPSFLKRTDWDAGTSEMWMVDGGRAPLRRQDKGGRKVGEVAQHIFVAAGGRNTGFPPSLGETHTLRALPHLDDGTKTRRGAPPYSETNGVLDDVGSLCRACTHRPRCSGPGLLSVWAFFALADRCRDHDDDDDDNENATACSLRPSLSSDSSDLIQDGSADVR